MVRTGRTTEAAPPYGPQVNALFSAAAEVQAFCAARNWRSAIIGGVAVQRWGEPRLTRVVDVTIDTGLGGEEQFVDALLGEYRGRLAGARRLPSTTEWCWLKPRAACRWTFRLPASRSRDA